ncbi:MAG: hypothetical protein AB7I38_13830 [Dehalococcoidia bacterium]|jgi:hypothetical protein
MSIDLNQLFAEAGLDGPVQRLDCDYIVRRGHRARARRRAAAGATAVVGAGVVVLAGTTLASNLNGTTTPRVTTAAGPSATVSPSASSTPTTASSIEVALTAVALPDPAPGFPYRRFPDGGPRLTTMEGGADYWARAFLLAAKPEETSTDSSGNVVGGTPTGPEVTVLVGNFPIMQPEKVVIGGRKASSHPQVAGVVGTAITDQEKGVPRVTLVFASGQFNVKIVGTGGATTEQLVALGNALTGLG